MRLTIPVSSAQGAFNRGIPQLGNFSTEEFLPLGVAGHPRVVLGQPGIPAESEMSRQNRATTPPPQNKVLHPCPNPPCRTFLSAGGEGWGVSRRAGGGYRGTFGFRKRIALQGGVAATVTPVALRCATKVWALSANEIDPELWNAPVLLCRDCHSSLESFSGWPRNRNGTGNRNHRNRFSRNRKRNRNRRNRLSGTKTGPFGSNRVLKQKKPFPERNRQNREPELLEPSHAGTVNEPNRQPPCLLSNP